MSRGRTLLLTELSLAFLTAAAVVGMHRLFTDGSYRSPLLVQAGAAHLTMALLRRRGLSLVTTALTTVAVGSLVLSWTHHLPTTVALVPTPATVGAAGDDLGEAWRLFQDVQAPAPVDTGFLLAAGAAVWIMVYVADWAAFRASATFEALLPSATLFLFAAALGAPGGRVAGAALFAAAAMLFVLLQRTLTQETGSAWAATHRARGRASLIGSGLALIAVAVGAGALAGPNLPGSGADPVLAWRDVGDDEGARVVVSPMVDIRGRLVEQPDTELFTVRSPQPAYWRLTALDEFNGSIWRSSYGTNDADGELPNAVESDTSTETLRQSFSITNLAAVWLPAAFEPRGVDPGGNEVDWDARSSTLIVDRAVESSDGFTYQVLSAVPRWSAEELRAAPATVPEEIAARYLTLPDDLDPRVVGLAERLTQNRATPYDRALAIQSHLRSFTYDLEAPRGHNNDALTSFLFDTQRGYCEQFAGSFGALARAVGLPTRVAVGFTPGIQDPDDPELFHVRGEHAHAWNEVYLHGLGWVAFDPTPGRAPPGADRWLGVPAQQDAGGGDGTTATTAASGPAPTAPVPSSGSGSETQPSTPGAGRDPADPLGAPGAGGSVSDVVGTAALGLLALIAVYLVGVPAALAVQAGRRRRRAATPAARLQLAWQDVVAEAVAAGIELPSSLTVVETAQRLSEALPEARAQVLSLASAVERVAYAEIAPPADEAAGAERARDEIVEATDRRLGRTHRLARHVDVRGLWGRRSPRPRRSARLATAPATR